MNTLYTHHSPKYRAATWTSWSCVYVWAASVWVLYRSPAARVSPSGSVPLFLNLVGVMNRMVGGMSSCRQVIQYVIILSCSVWDYMPTGLHGLHVTPIHFSSWAIDQPLIDFQTMYLTNHPLSINRLISWKIHIGKRCVRRSPAEREILNGKLINRASLNFTVANSDQDKSRSCCLWLKWAELCTHSWTGKSTVGFLYFHWK